MDLKNVNWNDKNEVFNKVSKNGCNLRYVNVGLRADKDIVMASVKQDGCALEYASDELRANKEIVLEAVKQNGSALKYVRDELKADKEIVMESVKNSFYGWALQYASDELKNDKEVALIAVKNSFYGWALRYVSEELKADKDVVLEAVKQHVSALEYVSNELKETQFYGDLKDAIENDTLDTFKEDYPHYFTTILEKIKDDSISFNGIIREITTKDLEDSNIIDTLIDRFNQYEDSKYFNLDKMKEKPNLLLNVMKGIDFTEESLIKDNENKIQFGQ